MIHNITTEELLVIKEALDLAKDEFRGLEEAELEPLQPYVLTTGADEAVDYAIQILAPHLEEVW